MNKHRDDRTYLFDILEGCKNIESFIGDMDYSAFESDLKTQLATQHQITMMGEAANKISAETKEKFPELPWKEMIGVRNILVHGYMSVDLGIVWTIATEKTKDLAPKIQNILDSWKSAT